MKRIVAIIVVVSLLSGIAACSSSGNPLESPPTWFESMEVYAVEPLDTTVVVEGNIMAVFYLKADEQVLFWVTDAQIIDTGDGKWDVYGDPHGVGGVSQELVGYGLYQYQEIEKVYDEYGEELPIYLDDLDLQPITADDLPHSEHIGKLTAVNTALARPATVTRKYMGVTYDVQCLVTQSVVNMWIADDLNIGDYVLVSFIDEIPNTTELNIAVVTDKIYKSW